MAWATYHRNQGRGNPGWTPMVRPMMTSLMRPSKGKDTTSRPRRSTGMLRSWVRHRRAASVLACKPGPLDKNDCSIIAGAQGEVSRRGQLKPVAPSS